MPSHKNQHFVPRCHFKPFTRAGEGAAINLFNIRARRAIEAAPVKGQCARNYYYGDDLVIERLLQEMEGRYGLLVRDLHGENFTFTGNVRWLVQHFLALQMSRTVGSAQRRAEILDLMQGVVSAGDAAHGIESEIDIRASSKENIILGMMTFNDCMQAGVVKDLKVVFVLNEAERDFVTSDDPAIHTNRWHLQRQRHQSFGLGSAGALLFMPLSPRLLAICFDAGVYSVAPEGSFVRITCDDDVLAFNEHQYLHCNANIYFSRWEERDAIAKDFAATSERRPAARSRITVARYEGRHGDHARYVSGPLNELAGEGELLMHTQAIHPVPSRWPSILKYRADGGGFSDGTGAGFVRRARRDEEPWRPWRKVH